LSFDDGPRLPDRDNRTIVFSRAALNASYSLHTSIPCYSHLPLKMGQSVSKVHGAVGKKVQGFVKKRVETEVKKRAPEQASQMTSTPANPGKFMRGEGQEDARDVGQEKFLQRMHNIDDAEKSKGAREMPDDLLKFINDVGPATKIVDEDFTSPRLLKDGQEELKKQESSKKSNRERRVMPLMGGDDNFTTTRNTNFSRRKEATAKDFGASNLQIYDLLSRKTSGSDVNAIVDNFYKENMAIESDWTEDEKSAHRALLGQVMAAIEIPVLLKDAEGNFMGVYPDSVPGEEIKAVQRIPETKVKLVLADVANQTQAIEEQMKSNRERTRNRERQR
jgi:hypothetical protein